MVPRKDARGGRIPHIRPSNSARSRARADANREIARVRLTDVKPPSPAVVSAELAQAALASTALTRARALAAWVGPGKELTSNWVPKPAAAAEACRMLGISLPRTRVRSALDVDEFMASWAVAVKAGLVLIDGRRARVAPGATAAGGAAATTDPADVLNGWVKAAAAVILDVPDDPCAGCLIVLHELHSADRPLSIDELAGAIGAVDDDAAEGEPCPECGEVHDDPDLLSIGGLLGGEPDEEDDREHAEGTVTGLVALGAATESDGAVELTSLGSMLATSIFEGCAPAPDADAGTLVSVVSEVPPPVAAVMARPWVAARSPEAAARELLTAAEAARGTERVVALALARGLESAGAPAWREWADRPGFGAYARQWLADQGEPVTPQPTDEGWLTADSLRTMLDDIGDLLPPFLLRMAFQEELGGATDETLALLRGSGHPAAGELATMLTGRELVPEPPRRAGRKSGAEKKGRGGRKLDRVCQLKISLLGVSRPPVWRRVVVPADLTLGELHDVIGRSMGWEDSHLHSFSTRSGDYGPPGMDLGFGNESRALLEDVLPGKGSKLLYTYDFGDGWEHDVRLEETRAATPGTVYPACVAGKGACPPEDCGGPWGYENLKEVLADPRHEEHEDLLDWLGLDSGDEFDPAEFSLDEVNARLRPLGRKA